MAKTKKQKATSVLDNGSYLEVINIGQSTCTEPERGTRNQVAAPRSLQCTAGGKTAERNGGRGHQGRIASFRCIGGTLPWVACLEGVF